MNTNIEGFFYDMIADGEQVGECQLEVNRYKTSPRGEGQLYPDSWFINGTSEQLKPSLEIAGYGTIGNQGLGYGRMGLQKIYELSQELGCEGRVVAIAGHEAGPFYERCGFESINSKTDVKCFTPTQENLKFLYKNDRPNNLEMKAATILNTASSTIDLDAFVPGPTGPAETSRFGVGIDLDALSQSQPNTPKFGEGINLDALSGFPTSSEIETPTSIDNDTNTTFSIKQGKQPEKKVNFETGKLDYADETLLKIKELRKRLKGESRDPLLDKQNRIVYSLEENGLSKEEMGKTGDTKTGEVSDKHKKIAVRHLWGATLARKEISK